MSTLLLTLMKTSFSGMAGGGVSGKAAGIARIIITGAGVIITMFPVFILMSIPVGEDTTGIITGTGTAGTMSGFLTSDFSRTGRAGKMIGTGKGKEPGASRAISRDRSSRDRNYDSNGNSSITRGLKFRNKDNLRFNSQNRNTGRLHRKPGRPSRQSNGRQVHRPGRQSIHNTGKP
jgi:uncharacterized membrane protein YtjA (UPF0391 family)